jgi:hypothetical protein
MKEGSWGWGLVGFPIGLWKNYNKIEQNKKSNARVILARWKPLTLPWDLFSVIMGLSE